MMQPFLDFLKDEKYCVISTASPDGQPEAAWVAFSENDQLEIMIGTSDQSRKFQNLTVNPKVAIVFCFDGQSTMQYEGVAQVIADADLPPLLESHLVKQPTSARYAQDPTQKYLLIKPVWARISQSGPRVLEEIRFDI